MINLIAIFYSLLTLAICQVYISSPEALKNKFKGKDAN